MKKKMEDLLAKLKTHKRITAAVIAAIVVAGVAGSVYMVQAGDSNETVKQIAQKNIDTDKKTELEEKDLAEYVDGIQDFYVQVGAEKIDWMKGIVYESGKISKVEADATDVNLKKAGEYKLVYRITGKGAKTGSKTVCVEVVDSKKAQELAADGKTVLTTSNKFVVASAEGKSTKSEGKKDTSKKAEVKKSDSNETDSSKTDSNKTESNKSESKKTEGENAGAVQGNGGNQSVQQPAEKPTQQGNQGSTGTSDTTKPSGNSNSGTNAGSNPSKPQKEPVWHDPVYENKWVVDQAAWDETISVPIYETQERAICTTCGADISGFAGEHLDETMHGGYHSEVIQVQVGTETQNIHHEEQGHWERRLVQEGYWE